MTPGRRRDLLATRRGISLPTAGVRYGAVGRGAALGLVILSLGLTVGVTGAGPNGMGSIRAAAATAAAANEKQAEAARLQQQLEALASRARSLELESAQARGRSQAAADKLETLQADIRASDERLRSAQELLSAVAVQAYLRESPASLLSVLLAHGVGTSGRQGAMPYVSDVVRRQRRVIRSFQQVQSERVVRREELSATQRAAQGDAEQAAQRTAEARATVTEQRQVLEGVRGDLADLVAAEAAQRAAAAPTPVALPTGTALTPTGARAALAGQQAGVARSNAPAPAAPSGPPPAATQAAAPPPASIQPIPAATTTTSSPAAVATAGRASPTTSTSSPAAVPASAPVVTTGPDGALFVTYRVYATQYEPLTPGSVEVALPDKCVKWAALGQRSNLTKYGCSSAYAAGLDYRVLVKRDSGQSAYLPVKDVGPWNIDDNYWNSASGSRARRLFASLAQGKPMSQAGFYDKFNLVPNCQNLDGTPSGHPGPADQFGRCVLNPAGIDLSPAAAAQIGLTALKNEWLTVSFLWEPK